MTRPSATASGRLAGLQCFRISDEEQAALAQEFVQLDLALAALDELIDSNEEPAGGWDPLLGSQT